MFGDVEVKDRPSDLQVYEEIVLEVKDFKSTPWFEDISFTLKKGEVLGIAGMLGSGRTELLRGIFGADKVESGTVILNGETVLHPSPRSMRLRGLAFTPEDRKSQGLVQILSIRNNLCHASLAQISPGGFVDTKLERQFADQQVEALHIKTTGTDLPMTSLSGGNQQKVVVGKWLNADPKVILFDEPSRGIDVDRKSVV